MMINLAQSQETFAQPFRSTSILIGTLCRAGGTYYPSQSPTSTTPKHP